MLNQIDRFISYLSGLDIGFIIFCLMIFILFLLIILIILRIRSHLFEKSRAFNIDSMLSKNSDLLEEIQKDTRNIKSTFLTATGILQDLAKGQRSLGDDLTVVQRTLLDVASVQEGGSRINEAIEMAKSGISPEKIADQTGLPLETAKAISLFHAR